MVEKFHEELNALKDGVLEMGYFAQDMLSKAIEALKNQDIKLANSVIDKTIQLPDIDEKNENKALRLIALYQPMAKDMRTIACCLKMITYLARIGRYGRDIAKIVKELPPKEPHISKLVSIPHMANLVSSMIDDALKAFKTEDLSSIDNFSERDDSIDALRYSIFRECITYMIEDPKKITRCTHYAMIARYLERCADHACKMAEKIYYMVTGGRIEIK